MKIGDKVSFLSEKGGGIVAGFQGKNVVLVEDEDGFQIPTPINDVVIVGSQSYDTGRMVAEKAAERKVDDDSQANKSIRQRLTEAEDDAADDGSDEVSIEHKVTFKAPPTEREGGNKLSCYLAFVPLDIKEISSTRFEVYFVNDSNYFIQYAYMTAEGQSWQLHSQAEVEPNTKYYIEEIGREELNTMANIGVQLMAYKKDKPFALKPTVEVRLKIEPVRFYKLHAFQENKFFETPALIAPIIENDQPSRPLALDPAKLKEQFYKQPEPQSKPVERRKEDKDKLIVDLHIDRLLDDTTGMSHNDMLQFQLKTFRDTLEANKNNHGMKIIFIHGKGNGVLRHSIINELTYRFRGYQYQDASFQEYGYGATQVTIK